MKKFYILFILLACSGCYPLNTRSVTDQEQVELDRVIEAWYQNDMPDLNWECVENLKVSWQSSSRVKLWCTNKNFDSCYLPHRNLLIMNEDLPLDNVVQYNGAWDVLRHEFTHALADCGNVNDHDHSDPRLWSEDPFDLTNDDGTVTHYEGGVYSNARDIAYNDTRVFIE